MRKLKVRRSARRLLIAALLIVTSGAMVAATAALGASPKKGGSYVGTLSETAGRLSKRVVLKVSSSGRTGRVRLECARTRVGVSSKFNIEDGRFTAKRQTGSLLVWRLRGRFASRERARAKLYLPAACDGKGGRITLELQ